MGIAVQIIKARGVERFEWPWPHDNATTLRPAIEHNAPSLGYQRDLGLCFDMRPRAGNQRADDLIIFAMFDAKECLCLTER
jgi:hypothetical protein